jgi:hypothetical protein
MSRPDDVHGKRIAYIASPFNRAELESQGDNPSRFIRKYFQTLSSSKAMIIFSML